MSRLRRLPWAASGLAWLCLACGCKDFNARMDELFKKKDEPPAPAPAPAEKPDAILGGTVGSVTLVSDAAPLWLRGFGVVVGLGENGGTDCPTTVREYLLDYFMKEFAPKGSGERKEMSPQKLLDSRDSAVVSVNARIPAGAPAGAVFDVQVEALGSDTRSIEGGMLLPCELKIFDRNASGTAILAGRTLGKARGVVFTNPYHSSGEGESGMGPRRGYVLGGAKTLEERNQKLLLEEPNYNTARRIERRINERLGPSLRIAEARSAGEILLRTPAAYALQPDRLSELVTHLLLDGGAGASERHVRELTESIGSAGDKLKNMSSIWEGVGRSVLPQIQPLYAHGDTDVSFFAARAGIRLKDPGAVAIIGQIAATPGSPHRIPAIRELGTCGLHQALTRLAPLLDTDDAETRVAAYDALLNYRHPAIQTIAIPAALDRQLPGVIVDVVASRGPPLIYCRRAREPRIAVFGSKVPVNLPIFYSRADESLTLNATEPRGDITMFCRTRRSRKLSDKIMVPARVDELIRAMATPPVREDGRTFRGIGLHYSLIVQVLDELCSNGSISARFMMEQTPLVDILGPAMPSDRPETEEDRPTTQPSSPATEDRVE
jgi:hypothetical protein